MYKSIMTTVAVLALLGSGAAFAQSAPAAGNPPPKAGWSSRHQAPFAKLKAQLKLTQAQEPAWNKVMAAMQAMHHKPGSKPMMNKPGTMTPAPQVFDEMAQHAAQRADQAQSLAKAVKAFYAQLTPVQRAVLDTHLADARQRMKHHRHRGMRDWGQHGGRMAPTAPAAPPPPGTGD